MKALKQMAALFALALGASALPAAAQDAGTLDWMSRLPGDTALSAITIPGTHDSATQYVSLKSIFRCQDTDILTQVQNGFRYLDIRLAIDEEAERLKTVHSFADCRKGASSSSGPLYLEDILEGLYGFLGEHPTETVIFCVKAEHGDDPADRLQELLYREIDKAPQMWYLRNEIPTLDEARGRLVLAVRFEDALGRDSLSCGLRFLWEDQGGRAVVEPPYVASAINENQTLWVQDRFKYDVNTKLSAVLATLTSCPASEDAFSLNFTSTAGKMWFGFPRRYAKRINQRLLEYELNKQTCYGVVIVDFATAELAKHIYEANF